MKAIVYTRHGSPDVLELQDRPTPSPAPHDVLVRVHAASVNALEWRPFTMPSWLVKMMIQLMPESSGERHTGYGHDLAGVVEAVGPDVQTFRPGDAVFGSRKGSFAEYVCAPEQNLVLKPPNVSFDAAAAVTVAGVTALQALRDHGKIQPGQDVLIYGAGGGVGTFAVQMAKAFGARVTAVCSPRNQALAQSLGAEHVIDYTQTRVIPGDRRYHLILAVNGSQPLRTYRRALRAGGRCVVVGGSAAQIVKGIALGPLVTVFGSRSIRMMMTRPNPEDLAVLAELLASRTIVPVIDRRYPLQDAADAIKYLMAGHASGKVVITVP